MPERSDADKRGQMKTSTFDRAAKLYGTISGRSAYGDPAERFEDVTLMLFHPPTDNDPTAWVKLFEAGTRTQVAEGDYFLKLRELYNQRNPHAMVGEFEDDEVDFEDVPPANSDV